MKTTLTKAAAVAASAALAFSAATGVANAQEADPSGSLSTESLSGGSGELSSGSEGSGDSAGNGSAGENFGSLILDGNATGMGSIDSEGSLMGEPTSGSLSDSLASGVDSVGANSLSPTEGTGSVDTLEGSLGEPTTGSLAPIYAPIAGSLGIGGGATTVLGSVEGSIGGGSAGGTGSLVPVIMVGGSAAAVGAGIYFWPQIEQALNDAGIELPPLPGAPAPQGQPAPAPAPGPETPNGRG